MEQSIVEEGPSKRPPWQVRRMVGAVALGMGAVLAVVGSTLPLYEQVLTFTAERETYTMTLWGFETSLDVLAGEEGGIRFGVPVVVAAVLLAVSAVLVLAAPRLPARFAGPTNIAAIGSAALLTGSAWTVGQLVLMVTAAEDTSDIQTPVGWGTTALVVACVVALAGGLLVQHWPERVSEPLPEPEGVIIHRLPDAEADADAPPFGIPVADDTGGGGR